MRITRKTSSLDELVESYVKERGDLSPATLSSFRDSVKVFKDNGLESLEDVPSVVEKIKGKYSSGTANTYLSHFRAFYNYVGGKEEIKLVKHKVKYDKIFSEEEIKSLLKKPNYNDFVEHRNHTIITLMLSLGTRAATISSMQVDDIRGSFIHYQHLKGGDTATLPMNEYLFTTMHKYINTWDLDSYLFPTIQNKRMSTNAMYHTINKYCISRDVRPLGLHVFRHCFAREWVKNGGSAFELQTLLCHSSLEMTKRYVQLYGNDIDVNRNNFINKYVSKT